MPGTRKTGSRRRPPARNARVCSRFVASESSMPMINLMPLVFPEWGGVFQPCCRPSGQARRRDDWPFWGRFLARTQRGSHGRAEAPPHDCHHEKRVALDDQSPASRPRLSGSFCVHPTLSMSAVLCDERKALQAEIGRNGEKSMILKIGVIGASIVLALNVFGLLVLRQPAAHFFSMTWWSVWFPSYIVWLVLTTIGIGQKGDWLRGVLPE